MNPRVRGFSQIPIVQWCSDLIDLCMYACIYVRITSTDTDDMYVNMQLRDMVGVRV